MAEVLFSIFTRQAIRRGSFTSVKELIATIEAFIDGWNDRCHPFTWTKTADEILPKCRLGKRSSFTRYWVMECDLTPSLYKRLAAAYHRRERPSTR
jgi:hypothetical protein